MMLNTASNRVRLRLISSILHHLSVAAHGHATVRQQVITTHSPSPLYCLVQGNSAWAAHTYLRAAVEADIHTTCLSAEPVWIWLTSA